MAALQPYAGKEIIFGVRPEDIIDRALSMAPAEPGSTIKALVDGLAESGVVEERVPRMRSGAGRWLNEQLFGIDRRRTLPAWTQRTQNRVGWSYLQGSLGRSEAQGCAGRGPDETLGAWALAEFCLVETRLHARRRPHRPTTPRH